jgi:hypothetical protein
MKRLLSLVIICVVLHGVNALAQERAPKFTDYPARIIPTRRSVKVRIHSTPYTPCFRTRLREIAIGGQIFAGHYAFGNWGCGTCVQVGIVDLLTGRAYASPFMVSSPAGLYNLKANSRLLVVEGDEYGTLYFLWTGRHLLPISNGGVRRREPEPTFRTCAEAARS